ncbi:MAG TPA: hypothetical protein VKK61_05560, partial [Tepidisphaeraceae bacterium]|nr:hypothetical protein [Tepidisphaeraceae bacterium]
KILELNPNKLSAHKLIANKLIEFGVVKAAEDHFRQAIALSPADSAMLNNLAWMEATYPDPSGRDGAAAVQYANRAVELNASKNPSYLSTLAAAYAENGQYDLAATTQEQAIQIAQAAGKSSLAENWKERLALYRSGHAYHETSSATTKP